MPPAHAPAHLPALATPACAQSSLKLNEILPGPARDWDGSGTFSSRDDEWIEVVNTGSSPLTLDGFFVTDGDSIPRYAFTGTLAAGAFLRVTGKESFDWEQATGHPAFGLSLGNSGDSVMLWQIVGADTMRVDSYTFTSHEAAADRSIGRSPDGTGPWILFDGLDPYTGSIAPKGTGCAPTPGAANVCNLTPTAHPTWGALKLLFR
ncbi:MAG: lamin tail domain-containing protein [Candidatus Eisenbacteria bacterium]|nr:lamin tail domain-containing protein [Candidatus Eisenbacteria bacterium]